MVIELLVILGLFVMLACKLCGLKRGIDELG